MQLIQYINKTELNKVTVKLSSWNVNGIRAILKKGDLEQYLDEYDPDIFCLQETKAQPEQVNFAPAGYEQFWNSAKRKGYSGTAIFSKFKPITCTFGIGIEEHDQEGRVITLEFETTYLVTVYTPNAQDGLKRLTYRSESWDKDFLKYLKTLEQKKPIILCGDLNVAHQEIDLANPKTNKKSPGFTDEERSGFDNLINEGFIDTFRKFNSEPNHYTWWSYRTKARDRNIGWRIDYFCVSKQLENKIKKAHIHSHILGSDHCPVALELNSTL